MVAPGTAPAEASFMRPESCARSNWAAAGAANKSAHATNRHDRRNHLLIITTLPQVEMTWNLCLKPIAWEATTLRRNCQASGRFWMASRLLYYGMTSPGAIQAAGTQPHHKDG